MVRENKLRTRGHTVEVVAYGNCPRCGADVVNIGAYGDRTRQDVHPQFVADGVPDDARFALEPCGDIIEASRLQLQKIGAIVVVTFRD